MTITTSWHSYPSIFALGHRYLSELLLDPVLVEEKVDGSQLSFGVFEGEEGPFLKMKSKGAELNLLAPDNMFKRGVVGGLPDWYKQQLLARQFEAVEVPA